MRVINDVLYKQRYYITVILDVLEDLGNGISIPKPKNLNPAGLLDSKQQHVSYSLDSLNGDIFRAALYGSLRGTLEV